MSEVQIAKMERDIEYIKESQKKQDDKLDKLIMKFETFESNLENKFAPKYLEKVFWWVLSTIGIILIGAFLKLIVQPGLI